MTMNTDPKSWTLLLTLLMSAIPCLASAQEGSDTAESATIVDVSADLQADEQAGKRALERRQVYLHQLFESVSPSVLSIVRENGAKGTGFFVDGNGLVLTHQRVVGDQDEVDVILHDGRQMKAPVVERTRDKFGLALVDVAIGDSQPLLLTDTSRVQTGTWLGSIAHGHADALAIRSGHLSALSSDDKRTRFQVQLPLASSASGAPIFDVNGNVIGVADAGVGEARGVNTGIKSDVALARLDTLQKRCVCLRVTAPEGKPIFVDGRIVGKGPSAAVLAHPGKHEVFSIIEGRMKKVTVDFPEQQTVELE